MSRFAKLVGLPYVDEGTDPRPESEGGDGGVDCYGAVRLAARELGVELPENPAEALAMNPPIAVVVSPSEPIKPGDVFELTGRRRSDETEELDQGAAPHLAFVLDLFTVLHATRKGGTVIHPLEVIASPNRIRRRFRFRSLAQ